MDANIDISRYKQQAARRAVEYVASGMVVGLGYGSTAAFAVQEVADQLRAGRLKNITAILCSAEMEPRARRLGIPLTSLDVQPVIDLTIDGADEVDPRLNLIKGGGGALLREKIVAQASRREIIIVDDTKLSPALGTHHPVPVEVLPFGWRAQVGYLETLGAQVVVRKADDGNLFLTDQKNMILDCDFGPIADPAGLAQALCGRAGIVEHGLFLGMAHQAIAGCSDGLKLLERP